MKPRIGDRVYSVEDLERGAQYRKEYKDLHHHDASYEFVIKSIDKFNYIMRVGEKESYSPMRFFDWGHSKITKTADPTKRKKKK